MAAGTLTVGQLKVTLTHAYALGPIDSGGPIHSIVLTDGPIPADGVQNEIQRGSQPLLRAGKLQGAALLADEQGHVRNIVPFIGESRGAA